MAKALHAAQVGRIKAIKVIFNKYIGEGEHGIMLKDARDLFDAYEV